MIVEHLHLEQEGAVIKVMHENCLVVAFNLNTISTVHQNDINLKGQTATKKSKEEIDTGEEMSVTLSEVTQFAKCYGELIHRYTKVSRRYSSRKGADGKANKTWQALSRATAQCKEFKLDPLTYIKAIFNKYGQMNKTQKISFPYPNQLSGDYAAGIIVEYLAEHRGEVPDEMKAKKQAIANQRIPIDKDELYQAIRARFSAGTHTPFDVYYTKARQTQIYGEPKAWLTKYEEQLDG